MPTPMNGYARRSSSSKVPPELARQALADFIEASQAEKLVADEEMVAMLQSWRPPDDGIPSSEPTEAPAAETVRRVRSEE